MREFSFSFSSPDASIQSVDKVYMQTQHSILASDSMRRITKSDDSQARGKYHTIDLNEWEEIETHVINDKLLGVGREHKFKEAVIYIQIGEEGRTDICNNYKMYHKQDFIEYKKERGENKFQDTKISSNGTVWVGDTDGVYNFIVFVPKVIAQ